MLRVLVLVVFVASNVSAGGGSNCNLIKSLAPGIYEEFIAAINTDGESCSSQLQKLSDDSKNNLTSKGDFITAIWSLADTCNGGIFEYAGEIADQIAEYLGVTREALLAAQLSEDPVGEPFSCFQTYFVQAYNLVISTSESVHSEVEDLIDNYPE